MLGSTKRGEENQPSAGNASGHRGTGPGRKFMRPTPSPVEVPLGSSTGTPAPARLDESREPSPTQDAFDTYAGSPGSFARSRSAPIRDYSPSGLGLGNAGANGGGNISAFGANLIRPGAVLGSPLPIAAATPPRHPGSAKCASQQRRKRREVTASFCDEDDEDDEDAEGDEAVAKAGCASGNGNAQAMLLTTGNRPSPAQAGSIAGVGSGVLSGGSVTELIAGFERNVVELDALDVRLREVHNDIEECKGNIRVICRVRPPNQSEMRKGGQARSVPGVQLVSPFDLDVRGRTYEFYKVYGPGDTQADVFTELAPLVTSALDGYHLSVLAYGQTGAGKTHTMMGPAEDRGVNFRVLQELFRQQMDNAGREYVTEMAAMEIYNEDVFDLLAPGNNGGGGDTPLSVREDRRRGPFVEGLTTARVTDCGEAFALLSHAHQARTVRATEANRESSRSHCIVTITVRSREIGGSGGSGGKKDSAATASVSSSSSSSSSSSASGGASSTSPPSSDGSDGNANTGGSGGDTSGHPTSSNSSKGGWTTEGKLHLVDLAGSERLSTARDISKVQGTELRNINLSLTTLRRCLEALRESKAHVPYRDSRLTFLMKASFSGAGKVVMICNVAPTATRETVSSVEFCATVRSVELGSDAQEDRERTARILRNLQNEQATLMARRDAIKADVESQKEAIANLRAAYESRVLSSSGGMVGVDGSRLTRSLASAARELSDVRWIAQVSQLETEISQWRGRCGSLESELMDARRQAQEMETLLKKNNNASNGSNGSSSNNKKNNNGSQNVTLDEAEISREIEKRVSREIAERLAQEKAQWAKAEAAERQPLRDEVIRLQTTQAEKDAAIVRRDREIRGLRAELERAREEARRAKEEASAAQQAAPTVTTAQQQQQQQGQAGTPSPTAASSTPVSARSVATMAVPHIPKRTVGTQFPSTQPQMPRLVASAVPDPSGPNGDHSGPSRVTGAPRRFALESWSCPSDMEESLATALIREHAPNPKDETPVVASIFIHCVWQLKKEIGSAAPTASSLVIRESLLVRASRAFHELVTNYDHTRNSMIYWLSNISLLHHFARVHQCELPAEHAAIRELRSSMSRFYFMFFTSIKQEIGGFLAKAFSTDAGPAPHPGSRHGGTPKSARTSQPKMHMGQCPPGSGSGPSNAASSASTSSSTSSSSSSSAACSSSSSSSSSGASLCVPGVDGGGCTTPSTGGVPQAHPTVHDVAEMLANARHLLQRHAITDSIVEIFFLEVFEWICGCVFNAVMSSPELSSDPHHARCLTRNLSLLRSFASRSSQENALVSSRSWRRVNQAAALMAIAPEVVAARPGVVVEVAPELTGAQIKTLFTYRRMPSIPREAAGRGGQDCAVVLVELNPPTAFAGPRVEGLGAVACEQFDCHLAGGHTMISADLKAKLGCVDMPSEPPRLI